MDDLSWGRMLIKVLALEDKIERLEEQLAEARKLLNCTHNPPTGQIGF